MEQHQQVLLDLGGGQTLSIVQGAGTMGSRAKGTVEVAVITRGKDKNYLSEPLGGLDAEGVASYIQSHLQDRAIGWQYE